jgi:hypothetical protein
MGHLGRLTPRAHGGLPLHNGLRDPPANSTRVLRDEGPVQQAIDVRVVASTELGLCGAGCGGDPGLRSDHSSCVVLPAGIRNNRTDCCFLRSTGPSPQSQRTHHRHRSRSLVFVKANSSFPAIRNQDPSRVSTIACSGTSVTGWKVELPCSARGDANSSTQHTMLT